MSAEPSRDDQPPSPRRPDLWDVDVVLTSGRVARVRAIRPDDADRLRDLHSRLSPETRQLRFFTPMPTLPDSLVQRFVNVDHVDRLALVVELDEELIAVGRYDRRPAEPHEAEVAFVVDDRFQGEGIGSLLLEHLAVIALEQGIGRFVAETLVGNEGMLRVFGSAGFAVERHLSDGIFDVSFPIEPTEESEQVREARDHRATVASIRRLLRPRAVGFIGRGQHGLSQARMLAAGFDGTMASLTPTTFRQLYRGRMLPVDRLEEGVDLVVIDVPGEELGDALARCAACDAGVALVMDSGPAADTTDGRRPLTRFARRHGLRVVGPRSLGVANTDPAVGLAVLAPDLCGDAVPTLTQGDIGVFTHSADTARDVLAALQERSLGISSLVCAGDKWDISGNDLLEFWEDDDATRVIVLAVESFGNPRRFARLAERIGRIKPILILAPDDHATEALCRRTGVVRAATVDALAQTAGVFALNPEWFRPPAPHPPVAPPLDPDRLATAEAVLRSVGTGPLDGAARSAVLDAVGLTGWSGPRGSVVVHAHHDARFGPMVALVLPDGTRRVALAPLTEPDLDAIDTGSPAVRDVLVRAGAAIARLADLADLTVELSPFGTPAAISATAAPGTEGTAQIVRRLT